MMDLDTLRQKILAITQTEEIQRELQGAFGSSISKKIEFLLSLGTRGEEINLLLKMVEFDFVEKPDLYQDVSKTEFMEDDLCLETEELLDALVQRRAEWNRRFSPEKKDSNL